MSPPPLNAPLIALTSPSIVTTFPDSVALVYVPPSMLLIPCVITFPALVLPAYMLRPVEPTSATVPTLAVGVICFLIPLTYTHASSTSVNIAPASVTFVLGKITLPVNVLVHAKLWSPVVLITVLSTSTV